MRHIGLLGKNICRVASTSIFLGGLFITQPAKASTVIITAKGVILGGVDVDNVFGYGGILGNRGLKFTSTYTMVYPLTGSADVTSLYGEHTALGGSKYLDAVPASLVDRKQTYPSFASPLSASISVFNPFDSKTVTSSISSAEIGEYKISYLNDSYESGFSVVDIIASSKGASEFLRNFVRTYNRNLVNTLDFNKSINVACQDGDRCDGITNFPGFSYVELFTQSITSEVSSAVPEPANWVMVLIGFGMMGFVMRKRSNIRTTVSYA